MTPQELITRKFQKKLEAVGVSLPVVSLLLEALAGEHKSTLSSFVAVSVSVAGQTTEAVPNYSFELSVSLVAAIDDDKTGTLFKENHDALWAVFDYLARADNCAELGDENDAIPEGSPHVFAVDGFQLEASPQPTYQEDDAGGSWTTSFAATVTGRAN